MRYALIATLAHHHREKEWIPFMVRGHVILMHYNKMITIREYYDVNKNKI